MMEKYQCKKMIIHIFRNSPKMWLKNVTGNM